MSRVQPNQSLDFTPVPDESEHVVEKGETLSKIADQLIEEGWEGDRSHLVAEIAKLNDLHEVDRIEVGQELALPDRDWLDHGVCELPERKPSSGTMSVGECQASQEAPPKVEQFAGSPCWSQGDRRWRNVKLNGAATGGGEPFHKSGCAVTACAIALSKLGGRDLTPAELDRRLDQTGGYAAGTNAVNWQKAADVVGANAAMIPKIDVARIKQELAAGRSVVVRVQHVPDRGTHHFLTLVAYEGDKFKAIDPNGGKVIDFDQKTLANQAPGYKMSSEMIVFTRKAAS